MTEVTCQYLCKIGSGNPWKRWSCILKLEPTFRIQELLETNIVYGSAPKVEEDIQHSVLKYAYKGLEPKVGQFSENGEIFKQSNGFTEWFTEKAFDEAIYCENEGVTLRSSLQGFLEFYNLNTINKIS